MPLTSHYYKSKSIKGLKGNRKNLKSRQRFNNDFDRDLAAMGKVWAMLRDGAISWIGELGPKY